MTVSYLPITIVPVKTFHQEYQIWLSYSLAHHWGITNSSTTDIFIGARKLRVKVQSSDMTKDEIQFSEAIFTEFLLPIQEYKFLAHYSADKNALYIGPIIALMTEYNTLESGEPSFKSVHSFCEELHHALSITGGIFYVFYLNDYDSSSVNGFYFDGKGWKKTLLPAPNVVYNRVHSRTVERGPFFKKVKNQLIDQHIPIFNDRFLSKWEVHELLNLEEHLKPYLPETILFTEENLKMMAEKHDSLYLKPIHGSQGRNIIRLSKKDHQYMLELSSSNIQEQKVMNFNQLLQYLKSFTQKRTYLIQQSISLLNFDERQLDFRVLCHKNHQDTWKNTSVVARIAAKEQFVSNIARGGEIMKPIKVLSSLFDRDTAIQQFSLMKEIAVETANLISQQSSGLNGEFGIDIGIDQDGNPWIIEVNSKPSKNFEDSEQKIRPSAKAILEYCTSLAFKHLQNLGV